MLTGDRFVSEDRDILRQGRIFHMSSMIPLNKVIKCEPKLLAGHVLRQR